MARFISTNYSGHNGSDVHINPAHVRFITDSNGNAVLHMSEDKTIVIAMTTNQFIARAMEIEG